MDAKNKTRNNNRKINWRISKETDKYKWNIDLINSKRSCEGEWDSVGSKETATQYSTWSSQISNGKSIS